MIRKLKLQPEALTVASFEVQDDRPAYRGTVEAHEIACNDTDFRSCPLTVRTCASWEFSCRAEDQA
jgi:hypothetical protein